LNTYINVQILLVNDAKVFARVKFWMVYVLVTSAY